MAFLCTAGDRVSPGTQRAAPSSVLLICKMKSAQGLFSGTIFSWERHVPAAEPRGPLGPWSRGSSCPQPASGLLRHTALEGATLTGHRSSPRGAPHPLTADLTRWGKAQKCRPIASHTCPHMSVHCGRSNQLPHNPCLKGPRLPPSCFCRSGPWGCVPNVGPDWVVQQRWPAPWGGVG